MSWTRWILSPQLLNVNLCLLLKQSGGIGCMGRSTRGLNWSRDTGVVETGARLGAVGSSRDVIRYFPL